MAKQLKDLTDGARTIVYQMVVAALKADATLAATIAAGSWTTYLEDSAIVRNVPMDNNGLPACRMMPFGGPASSETQTIQNSPMGIAVVLTVAGHDVRDILNLWGAFEKALFPGDGSKTLNNAIRAALAANAPPASLQTINLGHPAIAPSSDSKGNGFLTAEGVILVQMTVPK
jgi:hypothetical protein